ncbi:hypothetical protein AFCA_001693 [Aspergillus flavus]|nr:hypothetical protein AFCA_001693 [Aspergillus flavus]
MSIGAILQIAAYGVPQMIGETSQAKWRGKLVAIELIMCIAGYSLSTWMTFAFSFLSGPVTWRFPLPFQFVFILIIFGTVSWLPESPRWLIAHQYPDEARVILADSEGLDINDPYVVTQHTTITAAVQYERENSIPWSQLLRGRTEHQRGTGAIRRLLLRAGSQAMQQLAEINVTSDYLTTLLIESVGLSNRLARLPTACNSISYLLSGIFAIPNIERFGRRQILMICSLGQGICYLLITVLIRFNKMEKYGPKQKEASRPFLY